ncbi:ParB/RepB/Spo0J family partition protein [Chloroflexus sp.]|uniref:ParB/RepB/Spo0J family partition protein n=1 Tax=Chloroflexus sp. TaxID=1904827 RepID=UPI002ACEA1A3|nr:ParB/RepB/Spo0J family partition protein [Chloroflexus sp.]
MRRLPLPSELLQMEAAGDRAASVQLASLRELGESLREHGQVQPAIVYPDSDPNDSAITYRLLHGQRRWTAAVLAELPTLWVVIVERPSDVSRLLRQFEENERRAGLVDMERALALVSLREALQREQGKDVPWSVVEARLQVSEGRRHDLMRLLRFPPEGQAIILRYGWAEWTLRPLHQALSAGTVDAATATDMLRLLSEQSEVTAPIVASLVSAYVQERSPAAPVDADADNDVRQRGKPEATAAETATAASAPPDDIGQRLMRLRRQIEQLQSHVRREADAERRAAWRGEAEQLQASLEALLAELRGP